MCETIFVIERENARIVWAIKIRRECVKGNISAAAAASRSVGVE
jgi:hypothetical protein